MKVRFVPAEKTIDVQPGTTVMKALLAAGLELDAPCGGRGVCGKCRVTIIDSHGEHQALACQTEIHTDMTVDITRKDSGHRILMGGISRDIKLSPAVKTFRVKIPQPTTSDLRSCWERVKDAVAKAAGITNAADIMPDPVVASELYMVLTRNNFDVEVLMMGNNIIGVTAPGSPILGIAYDIGTTTIAGYLMDLRTGEQVSQSSLLNPQVKYGADVIMRTKYTIENGLEGPTQSVRKALSEIADKMLSETSFDKNYVYAVTVVGNTCMHHLFSGISPASLAYAPYTPAITEPIVANTREFGFSINPCAKLMLLPNIAGFVGADTVGAALASEMDKKEELTLLIDIGTNGEMVLGTKDYLATCSTAAGPAFEGALITFGMRGAEGAIDHVSFEEGRLEYTVIGGGKPAGICGSGIIDLLSELVRTGIVESGGRMKAPDELSNGLEKYMGYYKGQRCIVLAGKDISATDEDIVFTQKDVREVQLAKGAMAAGIQMLYRRLGVSSSEIKSIMIAGAFGNYMKPSSACGIGLIPKELKENVVAVGNAAGQGAKISLLSVEEYKRAEKLSMSMDYLELAADPAFQDVFVDQLEFPGDE